MSIWSAEIKELERLRESFKGQFPDLEKELERLIKFDDPNVILLYSRRCLEVIITNLFECELKRERGTEPLKGIIDKLHKEHKVPDHISTSMHGLNDLSTYGTHPKDFDPEQVKPVLNNLDIIIKWYIKYKNFQVADEPKSEGVMHKSSLSVSSPAGKSIAVLPFIDMSPEKDQDYFCEGMSEEIINTLSHNENFKVIARTSAFTFKDKKTDIREIGRILDVETLLEGSVRKSGNRIRITAQLIKVDDGSHIWSESYDRELKDVFAIQDEISSVISNNLKIKLLGDTKASIAKKQSYNIEAYNLYLRGTYFWQLLTDDGYKKAIDYFEQALKIDPNFPIAYCGLGAVNIVKSFWGNIPPYVGYAKANDYANKALVMDSSLAEVYWILGAINSFYFWNWKEAERNYKLALEINPNSSMINIFYSFLLTFLGRHEESISRAKRAQELDPISCFIDTYVGVAYHWAGQHEKAKEELCAALLINPYYYLAYFHLGFVLSSMRLFEEAATEYEKAVYHSNGNVFVTSALISTYYRLGKKDQAEKLFDSVKKNLGNEYVPATSFYLIHRVRGEEDLTMEWLKKACNEHDTYIPWFRAHPYLIPEGSKYTALLKDMGLNL